MIHHYIHSVSCVQILQNFVIMQDPLEFLASELKKCFRVGDHVKVIGGHYEGDTGLIVRVEENLIVLFSDLTMHEVRITLSLLTLKS